MYEDQGAYLQLLQSTYSLNETYLLVKITKWKRDLHTNSSRDSIGAGALRLLTRRPENELKQTSLQ